jgi:hypothetical protein
MKKQLAEDMVAFIKPIREKAADLLANPEELHRIIKQGADKGRSRASETLKNGKRCSRIELLIIQTTKIRLVYLSCDTLTAFTNGKT